MKLKDKIIARLHAEISSKINDVKTSIQDVKASRDTETKSSMGDKYETSRAMAQEEVDKLNTQLNQLISQRDALEGAMANSTVEQVQPGSLVHTDEHSYFIAIGYGKLTIDSEEVYVISLSSPIGSLLAGLKMGDKVQFRNKTIRIHEIL